MAPGGPEDECCQRNPNLRSGSDGCELECYLNKLVDDDPEQQDEVHSRLTLLQDIKAPSPSNALTIQQKDALVAELTARGHEIPVTYAFRHWTPTYEDGIYELLDRDVRRFIPVIMSTQQSRRTWDGYYLELAVYIGTMSTAARCVEPAPALTGRSGMHLAAAAAIAAQTATWTAEEKATSLLLFTAPSLPRLADRKTPEYRQQCTEDAAIATIVGCPNYSIAFRGAPMSESDQWMKPDIPEIGDYIQQQRFSRHLSRNW